MVRLSILGLLLCSACLAQTAQAQARTELGIGISGAVAMHGRCERVQSDVIGCSGLVYAMLTLAPGLRLSPLFSVAAVPGVGIGEHATALQLTAEGRWHWLGPGTFDPTLGIDAGVSGFIDHLTHDEVGPAETRSHFAATASVVSGVAWQLTAAFALQLDARLRYLAFSERQAQFDRVSYEATWPLSVGVGGLFRW